MWFSKAKQPQPFRRLEDHCSFCGRSKRVVGWMVQGPSDVYICYLCTGVALKLYEDRGLKLPVENAPVPAPECELNA